MHFVDASGETHCAPQTLSLQVFSFWLVTFAQRNAGLGSHVFPSRSSQSVSTVLLNAKGEGHVCFVYRSRGQVSFANASVRYGAVHES